MGCGGSVVVIRGARVAAIRREKPVENRVRAVRGAGAVVLSACFDLLYGNRIRSSGFCLTPGEMCRRLFLMSHLTSSIIGIRIIGGIRIRHCSRLA